MKIGIPSIEYLHNVAKAYGGDKTMKHTNRCVNSELAGGYEVCDNGDVFSISTNWRGYGRRKMTQTTNKHGYIMIRPTLNGKRTAITVHRLVVSAFLPKKPSNKHQVRHLDGNKENNNVSNLAWGTAKDNANDREKHGKTSRGSAHSKAIKDGIEKSPNNNRRITR